MILVIAERLTGQCECSNGPHSQSDCTPRSHKALRCGCSSGHIDHGCSKQIKGAAPRVRVLQETLSGVLSIDAWADGPRAFASRAAACRLMPADHHEDVGLVAAVRPRLGPRGRLASCCRLAQTSARHARVVVCGGGKGGKKIFKVYFGDSDKKSRWTPRLFKSENLASHSLSRADETLKRLFEFGKVSSLPHLSTSCTPCSTVPCPP